MNLKKPLQDIDVDTLETVCLKCQSCFISKDIKINRICKKCSEKNYESRSIFFEIHIEKDLNKFP